MSGIYIPGREFPDDCLHCPCVDPEYMDCNLMPGSGISYKKRHDNCPLVLIPEHGDLIDRTAFRYEMDNNYPFDKATQSRHGVEDTLKSAVLQMLLAAPTIIPADKEGK